MMQIIWSDRAFIRRQATEDYILYSFGYDAYAEFVARIDEWKRLVMANPNIGKEEPLLVGMRKQYRSYVISKLSKCIYYVEDGVIVIVDWWDARRGIKTLSEGLQ